jgi:hypothetical protein
MQRQLLLEGYAPRRHPFRRHVRIAVAQQRKFRDDSDIKLFALSFAAFFVCFYTFIA